MVTKNQALGRFRTAVSLFFFLQGIVFATWANRIPDIKKNLGLNDAELGNVLFAIPVGQVAAMVLSAWLVSRYGSRRMLVLASVLYPLFLIPAGFADNPYFLMGGLFFFGMSTNLFNTASNTQGVNVENLYGKTIMASFHGLWSLGGFLGGLIGMGFVGMGIPPTFHFIFIFVCAVVLMAFTRRQLVKNDRKARNVAANEGNVQPFYKRFDPYVVGLGLMAFAAMVCEGCMYDWSGVYFMQVVSAPEKLVQLGYVVCMCTMTVGRFLADWFVTRFGAKKVICVSGLLIFSGMMLSVALPSLLFATIGFFFVGFGISSTVPICYSMAGHSDKMDSGLAVATVSSIGYLGFLIGPPLIGHISHAISLHYTFAVIACVGVIVAVAATRLPIHKQ
jgi:MFS family permease